MPAGRRRDLMASHDTVIETVREAVTAPRGTSTARPGSGRRMITFLVRHGDAGDKRRWDGPDAGRPLSPAGLDQAEGVVLRLEDYPVERILCSPTVRCQQTVQPLARDCLLEIEPAAALGVDADSTEILELFWDRRLANALHRTDWRQVHTRYLSPLALDRQLPTG